MPPERRVDLQTHSVHSDGTCTPRQIVELARDAGIEAVALTDHDTVAGQAEMLAVGPELGVEIVPGVELSVDTPFQGVDLLGYFIDPKDGDLLGLLEQVRAFREARTPLMLDQLAEAGAPVERKDVEAHAGGAIIGRPHFARALVDAGHVPSVAAAFENYLKPGRPGYAPKERLPAGDAIDAVHAAGGVAVLAHPCFIFPGHFGQLLDGLVNEGLDGLEVWYTEHDPTAVRFFEHAAGSRGLVKTGGSDFHGDNKPDISLGTGYGDLSVPYSVVNALRERQAELSRTFQA